MFTCLNPGAIGIGGVSLEESLKLAADAGFQGLDLPVETAADIVEEHGADHIRKLYDDAGLRIGGWGLPVNFRDGDDEFQEGLNKFPRMAKIAGELGAVWCATWVSPCSDSLDYWTNFELHANRLRECALVLRENCCRLGLEFVGPWNSRNGQKYPFIFDIPGMLKLNRAIGTGNVGLLLDAWHWYTSFGDLGDLLKLDSCDVVYVHVNDAPAGISADEQLDHIRTLPGKTGVIELVGFFKTLNLIGFDGPVVVEPFNEELKEIAKQDPAGAAKKTADALNGVWKEAGLS